MTESLTARHSTRNCDHWTLSNAIRKEEHIRLLMPYGNHPEGSMNEGCRDLSELASLLSGFPSPPRAVSFLLCQELRTSSPFATPGREGKSRRRETKRSGAPRESFDDPFRLEANSLVRSMLACCCVGADHCASNGGSAPRFTSMPALRGKMFHGLREKPYDHTASFD